MSFRLGALTAFIVWSAFPENPYVLATFGFFYSMPCFYYIVAKPQYATSARFVLLTYNLTCLYWCVVSELPTYLYVLTWIAQLQHSPERCSGSRYRDTSCFGRHGRRRLGDHRVTLLVANRSEARAQSSPWRVCS